MASRYYGVSRGETKATVGTSTTSKSMELVVDQAVNLTRHDMERALEAVLKALKEDLNLTTV